jgi:acetoin utilization deacetylase AcuC-like enzyme
MKREYTEKLRDEVHKFKKKFVKYENDPEVPIHWDELQKMYRKRGVKVTTCGASVDTMAICYFELKSFYQNHDLDWSKSLNKICKELREVAENAEDENEAERATKLLDECLKIL